MIQFHHRRNIRYIFLPQRTRIKSVVLRRNFTRVTRVIVTRPFVSFVFSRKILYVGSHDEQKKTSPFEKCFDQMLCPLTFNRNLFTIVVLESKLLYYGAHCSVVKLLFCKLCFMQSFYRENLFILYPFRLSRCFSPRYELMTYVIQSTVFATR